MAYLKCEVGKPLVLVIDDVTTEQGKFGPQTVFHAGDDSFAMSPESATKQLDHAHITDPIGLTLEFSKVDIGKGRTAINIREVRGTPQKAPPSRPEASRPTTAPSANVQVHTRYELYEEITEYVLETIVPKYANRAGGGYPDASAIASMVATLYIQANRG